MANTVLHADIKIVGPLPSGTGQKILTVNPSTGVVGQIDALLSGVTGDIAIDGSLVSSINPGVIVNADINASAAIAHSKMAALTASRVAVTDASGFVTTSFSTTILNYIATLSSDAQTQINGKQDTIVGSASTIVTSDLSPNKAVVSGAGGKIEAHPTTTLTEIGYVNGVTSAIQTQLDARLVVTLTGPTSGQVIQFDGTNWVNATPSAGNLPSGGTANQYLKKVDGTDFNATWDTLTPTDIGVTASTVELDTLIGIGGSVQSQLNNKLSTTLAVNNFWVGNGSGIAAATTDLPTGTTIGTNYIYRSGGTDVSLADGGTGASLVAPGADRILFWDQSALAVTWMEAGSGLSISGTTITATAVGLTDGDKGDITVSSTGTVWTVDNNAITYAKIQDVSATSRFLGRITSGAGDIEELTGTQATTLLDAFTDVLKGLAPASGGGTSNFLRADGTWAVPPGDMVLASVQTSTGKKTFQASGTSAGINVSSISAHPSGLTNGDLWYQSTDHLLSTRINGTTYKILVTTNLLTDGVAYSSGNGIISLSTSLLFDSSSNHKMLSGSTATYAGLNFVPVSADPSSLNDGDIWYSNTDNAFKCRVNGVTRTFTVT